MNDFQVGQKVRYHLTLGYWEWAGSVPATVLIVSEKRVKIEYFRNGVAQERWVTKHDVSAVKEEGAE